MHRTDSIDYVICLQGEVEMQLDDGATAKMAAGDVMVQRGTHHAWVNRGRTACRLAVVLIDATPKR
jgi:quercetin dioxygenase-like cupin family protein